MYDSTTALQVASFIMGMIFTIFLTAVPVCLYEGEYYVQCLLVMSVKNACIRASDVY